MVESFNVTDSGSNIWEFDSNLPNAALSTFMVDMARHAVSFGAGAVDVVAAQANFVPPSNCNVYAFNSETTNVPKVSLGWRASFYIPRARATSDYDRPPPFALPLFAPCSILSVAMEPDELRLEPAVRRLPHD